MTEREIQLLRRKDLAFFGAVTASLSHEINNSIAIVGELAGLLEDLLYAAEQGRPLNTPKLQDLSERLAKQVKKGEGVVKRLNRFAHSVDEPVKQIDVKELLQLTHAIAERFAFLKEVELKADFEAADGVVVETNPYSLEQAVFICIQLALSAAQKDDVIKIGFRRENTGIRIWVAGPSLKALPDLDSKTMFLSVLMKELEGAFDIAPAQNADHAIALFIPLSLSKR
jgi:signal transduction histidine kinase